MNKTVKETAKIWGTKTSNIISLCNAGWIPLSEKNKGKWCIPDNTKKPPFDHKEGCKLLKKIELYQCGAYKEALIINNDVEINRLKYMINNGIIKCDESKTNTLVSILGNSEITNLGNKILEYEKPKKLQSILSNVLKYLLMVAAVIGITFDSIAEEIIFESFRPTATYFAEKKLSEIRVGFTEQYVESKIGEPKNKRIIAYNDTAFLQTIDTNDYYTIICYYNQEAEELVGYMLIGNDPMLNYQTNRSSLKLFEHTVVESRELLKKEGISGNLIVEEKKAGERYDNNKYYYECKMQHSLGGQDTYYFGFGFVDIGYMEKEINMDTDVENTKVNFFTVFKSYSQGIDMLDFIKTKLCMGPVIGINKSDLSNLKGDSKYIYEKP